MYTATVQRDTEAEQLSRVFAAEDKAFPNDRASYTVRVDDDTLRIDAEATDTKALKALLTSVTTILDIHDKTRKLTERTE